MKTFILYLAGSLLLIKGIAQISQPLISIDPSGYRIETDIEKQEQLINIRSNAKEGSLVIGKLHLEALKESQVIIEGLGQPITLLMQEVDQRSEQNFTWYGKLAEDIGSASFVVKGSHLSGSIQVDNVYYVIVPWEKGTSLIYQPDQSQLPEQECEEPKREFKMNIEDGGQEDGSQGRVQATGDVCNIRVLVAYTANAATGINGLGFSDIYDFAEQAIATNNQSFINSNVTHRLELAAVVAVNYNEGGSNYATHVSRFENTNDGFMDEIHDYRDRYTADVGILIVNDTEACGRASGIGSNAGTAFGAVHFSCILNNFSFNHEIAHLHGCRHDTFVDNSTTPFAYGHGFVSQPNSWRTIMAYNNQCAGSGGCTRLNFWSNPDINNGGVAMGTTATNDNARVLDETASQLRGYRTTPSSVDLTNDESLDSNEGGIAVASSNIRLLPGFTADNGSHFCAYISNSCPSTETVASTAPEVSTPDPFVSIEEGSPEELEVYPNPSSDHFTLSYRVRKDDSVVTLAIYNSQGKKIEMLIDDEVRSDGVYHEMFDGHRLSEGIYFVKAQIGNRVVTKKIILQKN